ncbi:MAG TPA: hypothetical protein VFS43_46040 [Polyangiaceae bacterium]|nr:hypothetical protein [Polyangiaceae bacterium]
MTNSWRKISRARLILATSIGSSTGVCESLVGGGGGRISENEPRTA